MNLVKKRKITMLDRPLDIKIKNKVWMKKFLFRVLLNQINNRNNHIMIYKQKKHLIVIKITNKATIKT